MSYKPPPIVRSPILPERVRAIDGPFVFVPHRLLREGFFAALSQSERELYFFLLLAGDKNGLSFYHYDSICSVLECTLDVFIAARNALIDQDLIAFDGSRFQVLSLPDKPRARKSPPLQDVGEDPAAIRCIIEPYL